MIERITPTTSGPTCSTSASRRARPIPCSAVTVPPSAIAARYRSARARSVSSSARGSSWSKMKFGWRLPSPAWPNVAIRMSYFSPIAADRPEEVRHAAAGHADVLHPDLALALERAEREAAGLAEPVGLGRVRGAHRRRRAGRLAGPDRLVELRGRGRLGPVRLDEEHRLGVAVESRAGRRRRPRRSTACRAARASPGSIPAATIRATASPAPSSDGKKASIVVRGGGATRSRSVASVMIPSVPCDPTKRCVSA